MIKHVFDFNGEELLYTVEDEPVCGRDFCDSCGDCLSCYDVDSCLQNDEGDHFWVEYKDEHKS